jgi:hypothetical protein
MTTRYLPTVSMGRQLGSDSMQTDLDDTTAEYVVLQEHSLSPALRQSAFTPVMTIALPWIGREIY